DPVLRQQGARQIPDQLDLLVFDEAACDLLGVARVDLRDGRAGGAEGDAAELQARGRGTSALLDQVERAGLGLLILRFLQDLETVDDRAGRTDQVMAHTRA